MEKGSKIYVAGHRGLVGSAIVDELKKQGRENIVTRSRSELDLLDRGSVDDFYADEAPDYVFVAAAKVGGIMANKERPAEFIFENLTIQNNLIDGAWRGGVKKLLFLGSSCIYPKLAPQPLTESALLTGALEPTNDAYAVAKIAGIKMCQAYRRQYGCDFISAMPTNLYGPNDNYDLNSSHVLPALIRRFHEAKARGRDRVTLWGTGAPRREFLYSSDLAAACVLLMNEYSSEEIINVGCNEDLAIRDLAECVRRIVGASAAIVWDDSKPDGTPRKIMDSAKLFSLGWRPSVSLEEGVRQAYEDFLSNPNYKDLHT